MKTTTRTIDARLGGAARASAAAAVAAAPSAPGDSPPAPGPRPAAQAVPGGVMPAEAVVIAEAMGYGPTRHLRLDRHSGHLLYRITVGRPGEVSLMLEIGAADGRILYSERSDA